MGQQQATTIMYIIHVDIDTLKAVNISKTLAKLNTKCLSEREDPQLGRILTW